MTAAEAAALEALGNEEQDLRERFRARGRRWMSRRTGDLKRQRAPPAPRRGVRRALVLPSSFWPRRARGPGRGPSRSDQAGRRTLKLTVTCRETGADAGDRRAADFASIRRHLAQLLVRDGRMSAPRSTVHPRAEAGGTRNSADRVTARDARHSSRSASPSREAPPPDGPAPAPGRRIRRPAPAGATRGGLRHRDAIAAPYVGEQ